MPQGEERSKLTARLRAFCARPASSVLFDEPAGLLYDVSSAKALAAKPGELAAVEERADTRSGRPYLALAYADGTSIALSEAGIAFAPLFTNSGPLPELPLAVCFRDFFAMRDRLKHELYGHPEQAPSRDAARLVLLCIAILDGARQAGFEVGREEQELEHLLMELERRGAPVA